MSLPADSEIRVSLPGADRLARRTGAIIIGNGEAINVMRNAGIPETQLQAVAGGERVPIFTAAQRKAAQDKAASQGSLGGPPGASPGGPPGGGPPGRPRGPPGPPTPDPATAPITVHVWPSLHCLMPPGDHPEYIDTGAVYEGSASHACTMDVTRGMTYGLGGLMKMPNLPPQLPDDMKVFISYMKDREANKYSFFDGGQLMYNILLGEKTLLWQAHLGAYDGIMKSLEPRPDVAVMAIAGRANLNGRPFDGSGADFAKQQIQWIGEPEKVIWCLHDRGALKPYYIKTEAATKLVSEETRSKVVDLQPTQVFKLFD